MAKDTKSNKKKVYKNIAEGRLYINSSFNNTIVTVTDTKGNPLTWSSSGNAGFKGARKSTPYAATIIVKNLIEKLKNFGIQEVDVFVKGVGSGRESAVRALHANGVNVMSIKDVTPIPHNGCRAKKPRRV